MFSPGSPEFHVPDLLSACPLEDGTNPHFEDSLAESRAWFSSYNILDDKKRASFFRAQFELLCSHVYPYAGREHFRDACNFVGFKNVQRSVIYYRFV